jgi:hypothetical protein
LPRLECRRHEQCRRQSPSTATLTPWSERDGPDRFAPNRVECGSAPG